MATLISNSPEETLALGEAWGRQAKAGLVIGLTGELGAGKTTLVQGIARGLGLKGRVTSPSFALVNIHERGRLPLFHLDLYRLDTPEQIIGAGLEEYLHHPAGVAVVEWIERWVGAAGSPSIRAGAGTAPPSPDRPPSCPGEHYRWVWIETVSETARRIRYEDTGA
jgi:tRNA threonylcarbamoyladenosine biosynthesis protein TsaE